MATSVQSSTWTNANDAGFRTWGKAISDGIAAVGLVKVAVTGAVDWATAVRGSTATANGAPWAFEVWRFDDALQPTHPVFIKIEYGGSNWSTVADSAPAIWVTVSRGVNASGAPTNVLAPRRTCQSYAGNESPPTSRNSIEPIFVSSDGSSICVSPRVSTTGSTHAPAFVVDRSRDNAGTPTSAGGVVLTEGSGQPSNGSTATSIASPAQMHVWTYAGDSWIGDVPVVCPSSINGSWLTASTSLAVGDKAPVFPLVVTVPNHEPWQVLAAVTVLAGDAANGPFTANVLGRIRNYRSIPVGDAHCRWMSGNGALGYTGLCILWEED